MDDVLSLANIRESLIRQEDTIIFSLIERAQFAVNSDVYKPGGVPEAIGAMWVPCFFTTAFLRNQGDKTLLHPTFGIARSRRTLKDANRPTLPPRSPPHLGLPPAQPHGMQTLHLLLLFVFSPSAA